MSSINGYIAIKQCADGDCGIDIFEGQTPLGPPFRLFNNAGVLLLAIGPNGTIAASGVASAVQSISTTPVVLTALNGIILVDATAGNVTLTLPAANVSTPFGNVKTIVKIDSSVNTVTVQRAGADVFAPFTNTSIVLTNPGASVTLQSDGVSKWYTQPLVYAADNLALKKVTATPYTATINDYAVEVDATVGAFTFNLPAANAVPAGWQLKIKKIDVSANAVTVTRAGADTIEGANTAALAAQWNSVNLTSDGVSLWLKY